jgi:hypothetical protein
VVRSARGARRAGVRELAELLRAEQRLEALRRAAQQAVALRRVVQAPVAERAVAAKLWVARVPEATLQWAGVPRVAPLRVESSLSRVRKSSMACPFPRRILATAVEAK